MSKISAVVFFLFVVSVSMAQELKKVKVDDGSIRFKVPSSFVEMTPEDMVLRNPSIRNPIAAFSSQDRISEINIKISATEWRRSDQEIASSFFKSSILNLFDRVNMIEEGMKEIDGKKFMAFEFDSYLLSGEGGAAERKYNYVLYYIGVGRTLVFSFRCPNDQKEMYQPMMDPIFASLKIKE